MTTTSPRLRALSQAQFEQLRIMDHDEFGQGYPLWEKLVKQSNTIRNSGRDILANDQFRRLLLNVKEQYLDHGRPLAESLPEYDTYRTLIDEYNGVSPRTKVAPASQPVAATRTETAVPAPVGRELAEETHTPAPAPVAEPVVAPAPAREPASEPVRVVERDDSEAPAWFAQFREDLGPRLDQVGKHDTTLYGEDGNSGLVKDVSDIDLRLKQVEDALPRHENGTFIHHTEWFDRTVTVAGRPFKWVPAVAAFFVALLLFMLIIPPTWPMTGFWFSLTWLKVLLAGLVAIVVLFLTNRNSTQSASAA
jgi:hypothetical protein